MTIKEKMLKIIALAMSIKATDRYYFSIDWSGRANLVEIYVHERVNGESLGIADHYAYDGISNLDPYVTYDFMIDWLKRIKREWEGSNE